MKNKFFIIVAIIFLGSLAGLTNYVYADTEEIQADAETKKGYLVEKYEEITDKLEEEYASLTNTIETIYDKEYNNITISYDALDNIINNSYGKITLGLELGYDYGTSFIESRYDSIIQNIGENNITETSEKIYDLEKNLVEKGYDKATNNITKGYDIITDNLEKGYDQLNNFAEKLYNDEKRIVEESYSFGKRFIENKYARLMNFHIIKPENTKNDAESSTIETKIQATNAKTVVANASNPQTGDAGIIPWVAIMIGSLLGMGIVAKSSL